VVFLFCFCFFCFVLFLRALFAHATAAWRTQMELLVRALINGDDRASAAAGSESNVLLNPESLGQYKQWAQQQLAVSSGNAAGHKKSPSGSKALL
jgi:hypothetical protein